MKYGQLNSHLEKKKKIIAATPETLSFQATWISQCLEEVQEQCFRGFLYGVLKVNANSCTFPELANILDLISSFWEMERKENKSKYSMRSIQCVEHSKLKQLSWALPNVNVMEQTRDNCLD